MADDVQLDHDETAKSATLTFKSGRKLKLANVSREQAERFVEKLGAEYAARGVPVGLDLTRELDDGR